MSTVVAAAPESKSKSTNATVRALPTPFPTRQALAMEQMSMAQLEAVFVGGSTPDIGSFVGWEFRGINRLPLQQLIKFGELVGIKKFVKGFHRTEDGKVMGYNSPVFMNALDGRWRTRPSDTAPKRFGFFEVVEVDATSRDNAYLHACLLDYGKGGNGAFQPMAGLRDYVIQVDPGNPDLFLGKAYFALGPLRLPLNYFILERWRRGLTDYSAR